MGNAMNAHKLIFSEFWLNWLTLTLSLLSAFFLKKKIDELIHFKNGSSLTHKTFFFLKLSYKTHAEFWIKFSKLSLLRFAVCYNYDSQKSCF